MMNIRRSSLCFLALSVAASAAIAQASWTGHWKLDPSKSKLTGTTLEFGGDPSASMTMTEGGHTDTFKTDGQVYPTWTGADAIWKQVDDHTWQTTYKRNGIELGTDTLTVSPDGKTLTDESKGTSPAGKPFDDTDVYTRQSGSQGLVGSWMNTKSNVNENRTMDMQQQGPQTIIWNIPDIKATVNLTMDGKDCAPKGPTVPDGLTLSATPNGANSFKLTEKLNGKPIVLADYTLSSDGKTMTVVSTSAEKKEPVTEVWEKQ